MDHGEGLDFISKICVKHRVIFGPVKKRCAKLLEEVRTPQGWKIPYQLRKSDPSYKFRLKLIKDFVDRKQSESYDIRSSDEFINELKSFLTGKESDCTDDELHPPTGDSSSFPDLFENSWKVEGVVVRKSASRASVLVKSSFRGRPKQEELILRYDKEEFPGLGLSLKVGDIVSGVTHNKRKEYEILEPEIVRHICLEESKIADLLCKLQSMSETPSDMLIAINSRCFAAWKYIVHQERCSEQFVRSILQICNCICANAPKTMGKVMKETAHSAFLSKVLIEFIDSNPSLAADGEIITQLQAFLHHILETDPSCGQRVLNVAKVLTGKIIQAATELDYANCVSGALEFVYKLSSVLALSVPGAYGDLHSLSWRHIPPILTTQELQDFKVEMDDLPTMQQEYRSEDEYLDTNFRLIREECFYKLKKGIFTFVKWGDCDPREMMMYRITFIKISTLYKHYPDELAVCVSFKEEVDQQEQQEIDWESTNWLMYGNLLCISLDGQFIDPIWVLVKWRKPSEKRLVWLTFCSDRNTLSDAEIITKLKGLKDEGKEAYMAESSTFYKAFGPAMDVLQKKDEVPFKEQIVYAKSVEGSSDAAQYISQIKQAPDWSILYKTNPETEPRAEGASYDLLEDFAKKKDGGLGARLDDTQMAAVEMALRRRVALIQGPPGTGKSYVGVCLVRLLLSMKVPEQFGPILIVTYKNHALDNFLVDCLKKVPPEELKLARVGRTDHPDLQDHDLFKIARKGRLAESNKRLDRVMKSQLFSIQSQITDCYDRLKKGNVFGMDTFIEEASEAQIKSLLTQSNKTIAAPREVEDLLKVHEANPHNLTKEQRELIKKGLEQWLPRPAAQGSSKTASARKQARQPKQKRRSKEKGEGRNDDNQSTIIVDRSTEEHERRLAAGASEGEDEDMEEGAQGRDHEAPPETEPWERYLPPVDDSSSTTERGLYPAVEFQLARLCLCPGAAVIVNPHGYESSKRKLTAVVVVTLPELSTLSHLMNTGNIFELDDKERLDLMIGMNGRFLRRVTQDFERVVKLYSQKYHEYEDFRDQHHIDVLKQCNVIGMTVTGAAVRANQLANIKPSVMIVEEAAEILEPQLVAVIASSVQHLIMIGDHKQLRPTVKFNKLAKKKGLEISMFERLVEAGLPQRALGNQCRMRDELAEPLRALKIYEKYDTRAEMVRRHRIPREVENGLHFITHTYPEEDARGSYGFQNKREAELVCEALKHLCDNGLHSSKVTVLCSYRGQVPEIERRLRQFDSISNVEVTTIDGFQGKENDVILVSLVRSNKNFTIGFLKSKNRLCVAISRARCALYLFGNSAALCRSSRDGWKKFIDHLREKRRVGNKFPITGWWERQPKSPPGHSSEDGQTSGGTSGSPQSISGAKYVVCGHNNTVNINECPPVFPDAASSPLSPEQATPPMESRLATEHSLRAKDPTAVFDRRRSDQSGAFQGPARTQHQGSGPLRMPHQVSEEEGIRDQKPVQDCGDPEKPATEESTPPVEARPPQSLRHDESRRRLFESSVDTSVAASGDADTVQVTTETIPGRPLQESEEGAIHDRKPVPDTEDVQKPLAMETGTHLEGSPSTPGARGEFASSDEGTGQIERIREGSSNSECVDDPIIGMPDQATSDLTSHEAGASDTGPAANAPLQESEEGAMRDMKPVEDTGDPTKPPTAETAFQDEGPQERENPKRETQAVEECSKEGFVDLPVLTPSSACFPAADFPPAKLDDTETSPAANTPFQESEAGAMADQKPVEESEGPLKPPVAERAAQESTSGQVQEASSPLGESTQQRGSRGVVQPMSDSPGPSPTPKASGPFEIPLD